jgi:Zn-dependent M28 family amino/carboxypeptidase
MLLDLAKKYAAAPPAYSVAFIAFAGEEAGLIGSKYFTGQPLVPLQQIRFLLNLDLVGNGDEGITVVNATEYPDAFSLLQDISHSKNLIKNVEPRGKAANSDHHWFTEKGVPSFFIYTLGQRKDYHDVNDIASTLKLNITDALETLLVGFTKAVMNKQYRVH